MNPWTLLGWFLVLALGAFIFGFLQGLMVIVAARVKAWRRHVKTRDIEPAAGQTWQQGSSSRRLYIKRIAENGRIVMSTGVASWSDSRQEWERRVRERRMWLVAS